MIAVVGSFGEDVEICQRFTGARKYRQRRETNGGTSGSRGGVQLAVRGGAGAARVGARRKKSRGLVDEEIGDIVGNLHKESCFKILYRQGLFKTFTRKYELDCLIFCSRLLDS